MARKLRLQYAGAIYHVINRSDWREWIFLNDEDRTEAGDGNIGAPDAQLMLEHTGELSASPSSYEATHVEN